MRRRLLLLSLWFIIAGISYAQPLSFDIARFTPPKGWTRDDKENVISYTATNQANGTYCVLGIYKSINSSGDIRKDFQSDWDSLVVKQLGISEAPQTLQAEQKNGFDVISGVAAFELEQSSGLAILTSLSNKSRVLSIVLMTNDTAYFSDFRSFYATLQLEASTADQSVSNVTVNQSTASNTFGDYVFSAPPGWKTENAGDVVYLKGPDNSSTITILPMIASSGNLEDDIESIFWQVFPGWEADTRNPDHHIFTKGVSTSGWEYYKKEIGICKSDNRDIEIYAFIMLARVNNLDAVIAGSYGQGGDLLDDIYKPDWVIFFHSLDFKNFTKTSAFDLSKEILGSWTSGGSSALSTYSFASNGHFSSGHASITSHRITDYTVSETTTSFGGEGEYKIDGNVLSMISANAKTGRTPKIRIFYRKDFGDWHKYLGMLEVSSYNGTVYELDLRRDER